MMLYISFYFWHDMQLFILALFGGAIHAFNFFCNESVIFVKQWNIASSKRAFKRDIVVILAKIPVSGEFDYSIRAEQQNCCFRHCRNFWPSHNSIKTLMSKNVNQNHRILMAGFWKTNATFFKCCKQNMLQELYLKFLKFLNLYSE